MSNKDFQNGFIAGAVSGGVVEVEDTTKLDALETLIDESGVLEDTEGSVSEKIEELIDKAEDENLWYERSKQWDTQFVSLFINATNISKLPKMSFENCTQIGYFCFLSSLEKVDYYINAEKATNFFQAFFGCDKLKFVYGINTSNGTNLGEMFNHCESLETIQEPLDISQATNVKNCFNCIRLKNIKFKPETIKISIAFTSAVLSDESIQSIIDGLATVETAQTLTLNSAITLADEQKATINAKGWTLAQ